MTDFKVFNNIMTCRKELGLSRRELGALVNRSVDTIKAYELHHCGVSEEVAQKLCLIFKRERKEVFHT